MAPLNTLESISPIMKNQHRKARPKQRFRPYTYPDAPVPARGVRVWHIEEIFRLPGCVPISESDLPDAALYWKEPEGAERIGLVRVDSCAAARLLNRQDNGHFAGILVFYHRPDWGHIQCSILHLDNIEVEQALRAGVIQ